MIRMDEIDLQIVGKLTNDARMSFRKIAEALDISPDTVISRYQKLMEKGVIRGSTVIIIPKKVGYHCMAAFLLDASPPHILGNETNPIDSSRILDKLISMPNIILATKTVGDHDLLAVGVARDFEHLMYMIREIAGIPGVKDIQVSFWVEKSSLCPKYFIV